MCSGILNKTGLKIFTLPIIVMGSRHIDNRVPQVIETAAVYGLLENLQIQWWHADYPCNVPKPPAIQKNIPKITA